MAMMANAATAKAPRPTDSELAILGVLWGLGAGTVREIHAVLQKERDPEIGYTTVLKFLQIMTDKGLVERDESCRPQVYRARLARERTQLQLVRDLAERAFGGSVAALALRALAAKRATPEELAEIRSLLASMERGK
jgi:predicted transcriptional regulator